MSSTRNNSTENPAPPSAKPAPQKKSTSYSRKLGEIGEEGVKIGIIGLGVSAGLYPLDIAMHGIHTNTSSKQPFRTFLRTNSFSYATGLRFAKGYPCSLRMALVKNTTLTQRNKLLNQEKTDSFEESNNTGKAPGLQKIVAVSAMLGLVDTTFTHYDANQRIWVLEKTPIPEAQRLGDYFKRTCPGYPIRLFRNTLMISGLIVSNIIDEPLKTQLPSSTSSVVAAALSGVVTGAMSTPLDILYKNQVKLVNPQTLKTPGVAEVAKKLVAEAGFRSLTTGYKNAILYTAVVYNLVIYMEKVADKSIKQLKEANKTQNPLTFFRSRASTAAKPEPKAETDHQKSPGKK